MKANIQDKINHIKKLSKASTGNYSVKGKKVSRDTEDSLSKSIKSQKDADNFMAQLHAVIKMGQGK